MSPCPSCHYQQQLLGSTSQISANDNMHDGCALGQSPKPSHGLPCAILPQFAIKHLRSNTLCTHPTLAYPRGNRHRVEVTATSELTQRALKEILEEALLAVGPGGAPLRRRPAFGHSGAHTDGGEQHSGRTTSAGTASGGARTRLTSLGFLIQRRRRGVLSSADYKSGLASFLDWTVAERCIRRAAEKEKEKDQRQPAAVRVYAESCLMRSGSEPLGFVLVVTARRGGRFMDG